MRKSAHVEVWQISPQCRTARDSECGLSPKALYADQDRDAWPKPNSKLYRTSGDLWWQADLILSNCPFRPSKCFPWARARFRPACTRVPRKCRLPSGRTVADSDISPTGGRSWSSGFGRVPGPDVFRRLNYHPLSDEMSDSFGQVHFCVPPT
jgi:hypothetical protein